MNLQDRAMIATLHLSAWGARRTDKTAARETAANHQADPDALSTSVRLIGRKHIDTIRRLHQAARQTHYDLTAPWTDDGGRLLPTTLWRRHADGMRKLSTQVDDAVSDLIADYPALVAAAEYNLGTLFDRRDYPAPADLPRRYAFAVDYLPVPAGQHFALALSDEQLAELRADADRYAADKAAAAMRDTWTRLAGAIQRTVRQLSTPGAKIYDSLLGDLADLADVLPHLNIADDPTMTATVRQIRAELTERYSTEQLRNSEISRAAAASAANDIARKLAGII